MVVSAVNMTKTPDDDCSDIQRFYKGTNVFITGGTGFMGKILLEKLLRSTDVATIYLLIREKKGKDAHTRLDELFDDVIFELLRELHPKFKHRVVAVAGDCTMAGLGLSITDRQMLISNVEVVFHAAATVRFDENLKTAYSINVSGTRDLINLCHHLQKLKAFVHVSTAYSNCHLHTIDEVFYDCPIHYEDVEKLLEKLTEDEVEDLTPRIVSPWPNTYAFTKGLAECLIRETSGSLPAAVYRPAIVISTYKEPIPGWIDNLYGPTGVCAGVASGLLRTLHCDRNVMADIVPVDMCVSGLIAVAWDISNQSKNERNIERVPIYNYVSSPENPITWGEYNTLNMIQGLEYPFVGSIWTIKFRTVKNYTWYLFYRLLFHLLPALFIDLGTLMIGQKPRMLKMYRKVHKFSDVISYFATRGWTFKNKNVVRLWQRMSDKDKQIFPFSMTLVPWLAYFHIYFLGIRRHLVQEELGNIQEARIRKQRFDIIHDFSMYTFKFILALIVWSSLTNGLGFLLNCISRIWNYLCTTTNPNSVIPYQSVVI